MTTTQTVPADRGTTDAHGLRVGGNTQPPTTSQFDADAHSRGAGGGDDPNLLGDQATNGGHCSVVAEGPNSATDHPKADAHETAVGGGPNLLADQLRNDAHGPVVGEDLKPRNGQALRDAHVAPAVAAPTPEPTKRPAAPKPTASVRASTSPAANVPSTPTGRAPSGTTQDSATDHDHYDDHPVVVGGAPIPPAPATTCAAPVVTSLVLVDHHLAVLAERVNDLEEFRKASANQLGALTRVGADKDGKERGYGLPDDHPAVIESALIVEEIKKIEDRAVKNLQKQLKSSPLGPWVLSRKGLGAKTIARLLAATGDPYWNDLHDRPRTVSELWAYCGYRPGQRKQKGEKANWSTAAKMRAFNCIEPVKRLLRAPCISLKDDDSNHIGAVHVDGCQCSPYRVIYDEAKAKYLGSAHSEECHRCTGKGQPPAAIGSPRKPAHIDQMAIRYTTKLLLKDLWREAKRLHEPPADQGALDAHLIGVGGAILPGGHRSFDAQSNNAAGNPT